MTTLSTIVDEERVKIQRLSTSALVAEYKVKIRPTSPRCAAKNRVVYEHALLYHKLLEHSRANNTVTPGVERNAQLAFDANSVEDLITAGLLLARRADMGEVISECPAFKKGYSDAAPECVACKTQFLDEFEACRAATQGVKPQVGTTTVVANDKGLFPYKPFRPGTQAALLLDLIKASGAITFNDAAQALSRQLNAPVEKVLMNVKSYTQEWSRGKVNMRPTDLPFTIVIQNNMISYKERGA